MEFEIDPSVQWNGPSRCEEGLIRENWVLVDLLDVYRQIGVDVFRRMEEFTHDRQR